MLKMTNHLTSEQGLSRGHAFLHADSVLWTCGAEMLPCKDGFACVDTVLCAHMMCSRLVNVREI